MKETVNSNFDVFFGSASQILNILEIMCKFMLKEVIKSLI